MNLKLFLSDSYKRSIDNKLNQLVVNYQVSKAHNNSPKAKIVVPAKKGGVDLSVFNSNNSINSSSFCSSRISEIQSTASILSSTAAIKNVAKAHKLAHKSRQLAKEYGTEVYLEKCKDLKLKPNPIGEKRFVEQFISSIHEKSLQMSGLGIGPNCMAILINLIALNPNYVWIDLSLNRIGDIGIEILCRYITQDAPIIYLDLRSNGVGIQGSTTLFNALCMNTHITNLDFSTINGIERNRIGTDGCVSLANLIRRNQVLSHMNLAMCGITAEGCKALGYALPYNTSLTYLDLTANRFGSAGSDAIFANDNAFGCLTTLILSRNALDDEASAAICKQIEQSKTIKNITLSFNNLGKLFLNSLYDALLNGGSSLESLNLSSNNFDKDAIKLLHLIVRDFTIKQFDFSHNTLSTKVIQDLVLASEKNEELTSLDLTDTNINDDGAKSLATVITNHKKLQKLILAQNKITDKGGVDIAKAIEHNESLSILSLSDNELKDKSAEVILVSLKNNLHIVDLDVSYNDFGCMYYVLLQRMMEEHRKMLNSNVHDVVEKHIDYLKEQEQKLFKTKEEIATKEENIVDAQETYKTRKTELVDIHKIKDEQIKQAEIDLAEVKERYQEATEAQREKSRKYNQMKRDLEQTQRDAATELQSLKIKKQQLESRVARCQMKKTEQAMNSKKQIDDLTKKVEDLREQLKTSIFMIQNKKKEMLEQEMLEKMNKEGNEDDEPPQVKTLPKQKDAKKKKETKKKDKKKGSKGKQAKEATQQQEEVTDNSGIKLTKDTINESISSTTALAVANAEAAIESARTTLTTTTVSSAQSKETINTSQSKDTVNLSQSKDTIKSSESKDTVNSNE